MPTVRRVSSTSQPLSTSSKPIPVTAKTKAAILKVANKVEASGGVQWSAMAPLGIRFVRVELKRDKHADGFTTTALIPVSTLHPQAKPSDPNKSPVFFLEKSGGFSGITQVAGPFLTGTGGKVTDPFYASFLTGQNKPGGAQTKKYPSDAEDGGGGVAVTLKYPSDAEDGGGAQTKKYPSDQEEGGGSVGGQTKKYPSDAEDGGGGIATTQKYPSDNEDGGGGIGATEKFPSDNEDGGGGIATTQKYPSDNEDGGGGVGVTERYPSDNEDNGGVATTAKWPSDNEG